MHEDDPVEPWFERGSEQTHRWALGFILLSIATGALCFALFGIASGWVKLAAIPAIIGLWLARDMEFGPPPPGGG